jgi:hypothetical protein
MIYINGDDEINEEELDDEAASLDDDLLAEVVDEDESVEDEVEGFGLIDEAAEVEKAEEEEEDAEGDASLEDDAEDVDYDSFDDVDEF